MPRETPILPVGPVRQISRQPLVRCKRREPEPSGVFIAKLNPTGSSLVYFGRSVFFGGTTGEFGNSIAIDANGNAYVGGVSTSTDMPRLNPFQNFFGGDLADAFVAKLDPSGSSLMYSTYLGGNGNDAIMEIDIDNSGSIYATGVTYSTNYPTKTAQQAEFQGGGFDAFVTKLDWPETLCPTPPISAAPTMIGATV